MVSYTLIYSNGRGAGEIIRQIFVVSGQPYEDRRVPFDQWPALKPFTPFGQMPVLEIDGQQMAQSFAIARFLSNRFGLNGQTEWEAAQVDAVADQFKDHLTETRAYFSTKFGFAKGDIDALVKNVLAPAVKKNFAFFTRFLKESGSGFLVGNSLTWIDLGVAQHTADLLAETPQLLDEFPELKEHSKRIQSIPKLKEWIETRPVTKF